MGNAANIKYDVYKGIYIYIYIYSPQFLLKRIFFMERFNVEVSSDRLKQGNRSMTMKDDDTHWTKRPMQKWLSHFPCYFFIFISKIVATIGLTIESLSNQLFPYYHVYICVCYVLFFGVFCKYLYDT